MNSSQVHAGLSAAAFAVAVGACVVGAPMVLAGAVSGGMTLGALAWAKRSAETNRSEPLPALNSPPTDTEAEKLNDQKLAVDFHHEESQSIPCPHCGEKLQSDQIRAWRRRGFPLLVKSFLPGRAVVCCEACFQREFADDLRQYAGAVDIAANLEVFPNTYRGKIPVDTVKPRHEVTTEYFRSRDDAERALRVTAAFLRCHIIFDVAFEKGSGSDGNYRYSTWSASGVAQ